MDHLLSKNKTESLLKMNKLLKSLCFVLGFSWFVSSCLIAWLIFHKEIVVTPAVLEHPFTISESAVDASLIQQLAIEFTYLRFNITPENVAKQDDIIKSYIDPSARGDVGNILNQEEKNVQTNKISSQFYLDTVSVDASDLQAIVSGTLSKKVGTLELEPQKKTYLLQFSYDYGRLLITDFSEVEEKK